jgi:type IV secretory pathway TraG/TraD family ATPase VirD4
MHSAYQEGLIEATVKEFPIVAVNVLDRLGYTVSKASNQLNQITAIEKTDEQIGRDWWHSEYRVLIRWEEICPAIYFGVFIEERKSGGTNAECLRRCNNIIQSIRDDAIMVKEIAGSKEASTVHGAARWADEGALRAAGYIINNPHPGRLIIGLTNTDEYISVPERATHAHAIVCGRTGLGKSRGFFVPNLIERLGTNMIVTEATPGYELGELYTLTSGWRKEFGHQIYSFNPADMSSTRINPIDRVRYAPEDQKAKEAEKLAQLVILNGERQEIKLDPIWDRSEKQLLISLILHAAASELAYGHIGALRWLLLSGIDQVRRALSKSSSSLAQMEFEGWLGSTSENFRFGVLSGLMTKLNPWITDQMVTLTETTDIDLNQLKDNLFTFYVTVPSRSPDSKLVGSLIVNYLIDFLLDNKSLITHPVSLLLDEFTNFGRIANIADLLSIVRKAQIGLVLGFQNYFQLEQVYTNKEAQIIFDQPATQVYFRQKNYREAHALSEALGRTTIEEVVVNDSGKVQELLQARALATPDELLNLKDEVIVFTNDTPPVKLHLLRPDAYDFAMAYLPPERPLHNISNFVHMRGKLPQQNNAEQEGGNHNHFTVEQQSSGLSENQVIDERTPELVTSTRGRAAETLEVDDVWQL